MKERWNSMSRSQKAVMAISLALCVIVMVFTVMHMAFVWNRAIDVSILALGLAELCQAYLNWNSRRKSAYLYLAAAVFIFSCSVVVLFF